MFSRQSTHIPERDLKEIEPLLARAREALVRFSEVRFVKPSVLEASAHLPHGYGVAVLRQLEREGLGRLGVVVVDTDRLPVHFYRTLSEIPPVVVDEMGDEIIPTEFNLEFAFEQGTVHRG